MKAYKPSSATYKDSIPIVETTDTNHADNVNQAPKQLIENDIALKRADGRIWIFSCRRHVMRNL